MSYKIPKQFKEDILARVNIVDVISSTVDLKKNGNNYKGHCPMPDHTEKTPSFTVTEEKQFYHCFGCGAHGSAIDFLIESKGLGYIDAVKDIAALVGMDMPRPETSRKHNRIYHERQAALKALLEFSYEKLKSEKAKEYVSSLNLSEQLMSKNEIGVMPKSDLFGSPNLSKHTKKLDLSKYSGWMDDMCLIVPIKSRNTLVGLSIIFNEHDQCFVGSSENENTAGALFQSNTTTTDTSKATVFMHILDMIKANLSTPAYSVTNEQSALKPQHYKTLSKRFDLIHIQNKPGTMDNTVFSIIPILNNDAVVSFGYQDISLTGYLVECIEEELGCSIPDAQNIVDVINPILKYCDNPLWKLSLAHELSQTYGLDTDKILEGIVGSSIEKKNQMSIDKNNRPMFSI